MGTVVFASHRGSDNTITGNSVKSSWWSQLMGSSGNKVTGNVVRRGACEDNADGDDACDGNLICRKRIPNRSGNYIIPIWDRSFAANEEPKCADKILDYGPCLRLTQCLSTRCEAGRCLPANIGNVPPDRRKAFYLDNDQRNDVTIPGSFVSWTNDRSRGPWIRHKDSCMDQTQILQASAGRIQNQNRTATYIPANVRPSRCPQGTICRGTNVGAICEEEE